MQTSVHVAKLRQTKNVERFPMQADRKPLQIEPLPR
jgi:hypothetical protein